VGSLVGDLSSMSNDIHRMSNEKPGISNDMLCMSNDIRSTSPPKARKATGHGETIVKKKLREFKKEIRP
jgi:hypothetical protein